MPSLDVSELNIVLGILGKSFVGKGVGVNNLLTDIRDLYCAVWPHFSQDQGQVVLG